MRRVGQMLGMLHSISMPGAGVPDDEGVWAEAATYRRTYLNDRLGDCGSLAAAGFSKHEIDQVIEVLQGCTDDPGDPVLCHGDVSAQHVFIDPELRIVGLIDWGMWHADSPVSELAGLARANSPTDFSAILDGHGDTDTDPAFDHLMSWHGIAQATHQVAWFVASGQTAELHRAAAALRNVLAIARSGSCEPH